MPPFKPIIATQSYSLYGPITHISGNVFIIVDVTTGITFIDTGLPGTERKLKEVLQTIGKTLKDIAHILITHGDGDHIGSANRLATISNAEVISSQSTANLLKIPRSPGHFPFPFSVLASLGFKFHIQPLTPDHIVKDGDLLDIAGGIRIIATPGHTSDHLCYFWEPEKVLFAGDTLFNTKRLQLSPRIINNCTYELRKSVRKILSLHPTVICCGHGRNWHANNDPDRIDAMLKIIEL